MQKRLIFILLTAAMMSGCTHSNIEETYSKILQSQPKWKLEKSDDTRKTFIDTTLTFDEDKSPFLRVKTLGGKYGTSETVYIYRLDCENQRAANYYRFLNDRPGTYKDPDDYGYIEHRSGNVEERFFYNPIQPKSIERLWRSFPLGEDLFKNTCKLDASTVKPQNKMMTRWVYLEDLSKVTFSATYVNMDQSTQLKKNGKGDLTLKSFDPGIADVMSSREDKLKIDCAAEIVTMRESILRDNDFEYAPSTDQTHIIYHRVFNADITERLDSISLSEALIEHYCK